MKLRDIYVKCLDELMRCLGMFMGCQIRPRLWVKCVCTCKRPSEVVRERKGIFGNVGKNM